MDLWLDSELHVRREEALAFARRARLIRLAESGRSGGVRGRIADGADVVSAALASFAEALRGPTTAA